MDPISPSPTRKKRIFIVEDNTEIIGSYRELLSDRYHLTTRTSASEAIRYLQKDPVYDLAIIDVRLPDLPGIEVLKEIKKRQPCVPAIIVTAYGNERVAVNAFRCGARDYVKKPFRQAELLDRISFCLSLPVPGQVQRKILTTEAEKTSDAMVCHLGEETKPRVLDHALQFIHNNFASEISLERVARVEGLSKFHFSRLFKKTIGLTYQSYLNRVRIDQAKNLLKDDVLSVTDTGYSVGYTDLTHFERIFKKLTGITPSQYRRQSD